MSNTTAVAQAAKAKARYGPNNLDVQFDGTDLVIRCDASRILVAAGTPNPRKITKDFPEGGTPRALNLHGTSRGMMVVGNLKVSVNVCSDPAD